jgi:predicted TIM-barrel fold metal-dependent hydrolase
MGFSATNPICDPLYQVVQEANRFVMFHTGHATYPFDLDKGRLEQYSRVQREHPEMTMVLAHAGYPLWGHEAIEVAKGHPRTYLDVSGWTHGLHDGTGERFLRECFDTMGARRTIFASDHVSGPLTSGNASLIAPWRGLYERVAADAGVASTDYDLGAEELLGMRDAK